MASSSTTLRNKRAQACRQQNLEGALDPADLQSFAYQIANGMVTAIISIPKVESMIKI